MNEQARKKIYQFTRKINGGKFTWFWRSDVNDRASIRGVLKWAGLDSKLHNILLCQIYIQK